MEIALSLDDKYVMPCGVLICSICENNRNEEINFHLFIEELILENRNSLQRIVDKYNKQLIFHVIDSSKLQNCPINRKEQAKYITLATYYRFLLPEILLDLDKILYLDCDIIVRGSLVDLWNINLQEYALGVVEEASAADLEIYKRLGYEYKYGYFNAGVLLINLNYWRKHNLTRRLFDYVSKFPERLICHDQDTLNAVLHDNKILLPLKYNVQDMYYYGNLKNDFIDVDELKDACENPVVVHFSGISKPWFKECTHKFKPDFMKYLSMTEWSGMKIGHINMGWKDIYWYYQHLFRVFLGKLKRK